MERRNVEKRNKCQKICEENKLLIVLICLVVVGTIAGTLLLFAIPLAFVKEPMPYRLPGNFIPYHYEIEIKPYLVPGNFIFEGQVAIYVMCAKITDTIVLHSRNLTIDKHSVSVTDIEENRSVEILLLDYDFVNDLLILQILENLKERRDYWIHMKYKGTLKEGETGFYVSTYLDEEKVKHYIASSQFEPVNARGTFPCFDEPQLKATFSITLVRWNNMTSLSNMPKLTTESREGDWKADIFQKSMRMSTYLVAFIFCDYVGVNKGKIRVWAPIHRIKNAEFALDVSYKALTFFEKKLRIPYIAPKLDMVPVPALEAAAMENWGLIIYEQSALLTPEDKDEENEDTLINIAETVTHEIAHQWFGNLVTMKWWSDIWLNEGLTSYMENLAMIEIFPKWYEIDPTIKNMYENIILDCTEHHPLWQPVHNSQDASNSFKGVTYPKGAMIARMAHHILGEQAFWTGIRRYLNSNSYGNVEEADLWRYLTAAQIPSTERLDMAEIMYSWTHLSGMPIVMVERDYDKGTANFSQISCKAKDKEHQNDRWNIPVIIETKYSANLLGKIIWLKKRNLTVDEMPEEDQWIVVNGDSTGHYIVHYDRENWKLIHKQLILNNMVFDATQRYKFLFELVFLERIDDIEIDLLFQHLIYLREERDYQILLLASSLSSTYMRMFDEMEFHQLMKEFLIYVWENVYNRVRLGEDHDTSFDGIDYSYSIPYILCGLEYKPCVKDAEQVYLRLKDEEEIDMEGSSNNMVAICTVAQSMNYEQWKELKDTIFGNETNSLDIALECSNNASVIRGELQEAFENMETLSLSTFRYAIKGHNTSFHETMRFFDENFETLMQNENFLQEWHSLVFKGIMNVSRIRKIIELLNRHSAAFSGSNAEKFAAFAKSLQKGLPEGERKARILKSWLSTKPWIQFNESL